MYSYLLNYDHPLILLIIFGKKNVTITDCSALYDHRLKCMLFISIAGKISITLVCIVTIYSIITSTEPTQYNAAYIGDHL